MSVDKSIYIYINIKIKIKKNRNKGRSVSINVATHETRSVQWQRCSIRTGWAHVMRKVIRVKDDGKTICLYLHLFRGWYKYFDQQYGA